MTLSTVSVSCITQPSPPDHRDHLCPFTLADADQEFNTILAKLRAPGEWANAHLKNWRILATRYRGDLTRLDNVTAAVCGLQILNEQFSECRLTFDRVRSVLISE